MGPPLPDLDDDDDDDLDVVVPAPKSKPAAPPIDLDDDDEDLLPPQGSLKMHSLDASKNITPPSVDDLLEDDDDLDLPPPPPPPAAAAAKAPSVASTKSTPSAPLSKPVDSPSSAATPATSILAAKTSGAASSQQAEGSDAARQGPRAIENPRRKSTTMHVQVGHVTLEGWLEKQNPSWPHAYKRRYCIISGSTLAYYDCPPQPGHDPLGHFSLCGATISLDCDKRPFSFGISGPTLTHKGISGRMYIFAANTKDEMTQWVTAMQTAAANTTSNELHWFEKLVEGIY